MISTEIPLGREFNDMTLRNSRMGDSSSDEDEENRDAEEKEESIDELNFHSFINQHIKKGNDRRNKE